MNNSTFQLKISQRDRPVVVDFWAPWCVPCQMTKPILEKLATIYADKVDFLPVNADDSREVLEQFRVTGIPTVLTIRDGNVVGRVTGTQNEAAYRAMFQALAEGGEVKVPISAFNRLLRLGAGVLLIITSISAGYWLLAGIGGIVAFLGVYDRCPVWAAITRRLRSSQDSRLIF